MNGKSTFTLMEVNELNRPQLYKLNNLKRIINKNFELYDVRKIDLDYEQNKNLYKYMKQLAYFKYRRKNLIKIIDNYNKNIIKKEELKKLERRNSHDFPYHKKTYHILIYRNLYNYKFKPYALPLNKEDKLNELNLTNAKLKINKTKKKNIIINPYLEMKYKHLLKICQKLNNKNKIQEKLEPKGNLFRNNNMYNLKKIYNSISLSELNLKNNKNNKKRNILPKIKKNHNSSEIINEKNKSLRLSNNKNKSFNLILPKIRNDCLSTIKNLNKLEYDLKIFKYRITEDISLNEDKINLKINNKYDKYAPGKLYQLISKSNKSKSKKIISHKKNNFSTESTSANNKSNFRILKNETNNNKNNELGGSINNL